MPMISAAMNAPGMLPSPPTTVTTNTSGDDRQVHVEIRRLARQLQCARKARKHRAQKEHAGKQKRLIDAERAGHLAIFSGGAHQQTPASAGQHPRQRGKRDRCEHDEQHVVLRQGSAADIDRARQARRARAEQILGSPQGECYILDDEHDAERGDQLQQFGCAVESAKQQPLDQCADDADQRGSGHDRDPVSHRATFESTDERVADIRAQHHQRPVREVDDARHAEDQRQACRHHEKRRGAGHPIENLRGKGGERHRRIMAARRTGLPRYLECRRCLRKRRDTQRLSSRDDAHAPSRRWAGNSCHPHISSRPSRPCRP